MRQGLPLGSVRKGLPRAEFVRVAVARRPWKSLEDKHLIHICAYKREKAYVLVIEPVFDSCRRLRVMAFHISDAVKQVHTISPPEL